MAEQPPPSAADLVGHAKHVLDSLPRAIAIVGREGEIVGWNRTAERLTGHESSDVLGRVLVDTVLQPHDRSTASEVVEAALAGERWTGDLVAVGAAGRLVRLSCYVGPLLTADDEIAGVVVSAEDVTDRRTLERHAAEVAERLELALAAGELGTWRWDMASGATTWDARMEDLFGLPEGGFDGTFDAWIALLHPDDVDAARATVERAVETKSPYLVDHRVVRPDGTVRWIRGRGAVTLDDHGNVTGTIGCAGDVTEGKLLELDRERRALEAERLATLERLQRERLEFLTSLNAAALVAAETRELMRRVTRAAVPQLGDWCSLHFVPEPGEAPIVEVAHADPAKVDWALSLQERYPYDPDAPTGVPAVIRTGQTEFLRHIDAAFVEQFLDESGPISPAELRDILDALQLTSVITVPLVTKRGVLGAVQFVSAESKRRYDDDDLALAEAAAGRIAEVLEASWMLGQHRTIAATLQSALLPPALPTIDGVGVEARYWAAGPASDVGGDFYDVFRVDDRTWALVIGDVCGTGAAAAAVTAIARHTIRAAATHGLQHRDVIDWLDAAMRAGGRDRFCTVLYATLERAGADTWHVRLVSGGHPLPVLCRADGAVEVVGTPGTLVGILPSVTVTPTDVELGPGDTLVLYTDGVTDVPPPHQLDEDDLIALVSSAASGAASARQVADRLGSAIETHLSIRERPDDVAVLVVRVDDAG